MNEYETGSKPFRAKFKSENKTARTRAPPMAAHVNL